MGFVPARSSRVSCPKDPSLLRFISRDTNAEERLEVVRHLLVCNDCRDLAVMLARLLPSRSAAKTAAGRPTD